MGTSILWLLLVGLAAAAIVYRSRSNRLADELRELKGASTAQSASLAGERERLEKELERLRQDAKEHQAFHEKVDKLIAKHKETVSELNKKHYQLRQAEIEIDLQREYRQQLMRFFTGADRLHGIVPPMNEDRGLAGETASDLGKTVIAGTALDDAF